VVHEGEKKGKRGGGEKEKGNNVRGERTLAESLAEKGLGLFVASFVRKERGGKKGKKECRQLSPAPIYSAPGKEKKRGGGGGGRKGEGKNFPRAKIRFCRQRGTSFSLVPRGGGKGERKSETKQKSLLGNAGPAGKKKQEREKRYSSGVS